MKKIRFILQWCGQCGIDVNKDFYCTEIVKVSDRAYELLTGGGTGGGRLNFMCAEKIPEEEQIE